MPTATNSKSRARSRALAILVGYNLPFALWSAAALLRVWRGGRSLWPCPIKSIVTWCPACGLTRAYAALLRGEGLQSAWLGIILLIFIANMAHSLLKARRVSMQEKSGGPPSV